MRRRKPKTQQPVWALYVFNHKGDFDTIHSVHVLETRADSEAKRLGRLGAYGAIEVVRFQLPLPDGSPIKKPGLTLA